MAGMQRFQGRTIIVTGAGSGIGQGVAERFSQEGAQVVLAGRTQDKLERVAGKLDASRTLVHPCDVSSHEAVEALIAAAIERFGGLDLLPVHARTDKPAHRILVSGLKGSRAPLRILSPLVIHGAAGNAFRPEVERILRDGAGLAEAAGSWQGPR